MITREDLVKQVALQLQVALTAWHELHPDDSDEDACERSLQIVEQGLEEVLGKGESSEDEQDEQEDSNGQEDDLEDLGSSVMSNPFEAPARPTPPLPKRTSSLPPPPSEPLDPSKKFVPASFRDLLIEIGRELPDGFDISTIIDEAEGRGWSHSNPRQYVSLVASHLVRGGILVRKDRGMYALSAAMLE